MPESGRKCELRQKRQGTKLAKLNVACSKEVGTNKHGEHYRCVAEKAKKTKW